ncbi:MAG: hypothetical protein ACOYOB_10675 [Myxococcota bacterium]
MNAARSLPVLLVAVSFCSGCFSAVGPVFGYAFDRGGMVGWEISGGHGLLHGVVGQSIRPPDGDWGDGQGEEVQLPAEPTEFLDEESVTYFAVEPWLYLGGTLGVTSSSADDDVGLCLGAWEGAPIMPWPALPSGELIPFVSAAIGVRWLHGTAELYFTPKVGLLLESSLPSGE